MAGAPDHMAHLRAEPAPAPPVQALLVGRPVADALVMLPRLFNLCRHAQGLGAALALGRAAPAMSAAHHREILRDHLFKLHVTWPGFFGHAPRPLPMGWETEPSSVAQSVFGRAGAAPVTPAAWEAFLASDQGAAPVLKAISGCFAPFMADPGALARPDTESLFEDLAQENSLAGRHRDHPVMRHIAATWGHGPLWRAAARLFDIEACLSGALPAPAVPAPGRAIVPAARGSYAIEARAEGGILTALTRHTPTDHLLAPGGILPRALANLPATCAGLAPLLLDILDPCRPVRLEEVRHA